MDDSFDLRLRLPDDYEMCGGCAGTGTAADGTRCTGCKGRGVLRKPWFRRGRASGDPPSEDESVRDGGDDVSDADDAPV